MLFSEIKKNFIGRYRNSAIGYLWHIITPLFLIMVYIVVFGSIFGSKMDNYWLYVTTSIFSISYFTTSITIASTSITANGYLISKIAFPREYLPISISLTNAVTLLISYILLIVLTVIAGIGLSNVLLFLIPFYCLYICFTTGVCLFLSAINVYYRDASNVVGLLTLCLFFITPSFYTIEQVGEAARVIILWNPLTYFVESSHYIMYYNESPELVSTIICIFLSVCSFVIGLITFKKLEKKFVDLL